MCIGPKPAAPKIPAPAPIQPPEELKQLAPEVGGKETVRSSNVKKKTGRDGLRLDLQVGGGGNTSSGVNIPKL